MIEKDESGFHSTGIFSWNEDKFTDFTQQSTEYTLEENDIQTKFEEVEVHRQLKTK